MGIFQRNLAALFEKRRGGGAIRLLRRHQGGRYNDSRKDLNKPAHEPLFSASISGFSGNSPQRPECRGMGNFPGGTGVYRNEMRHAIRIFIALAVLVPTAA